MKSSNTGIKQTKSREKIHCHLCHQGKLDAMLEQ